MAPLPAQVAKFGDPGAGLVNGDSKDGAHYTDDVAGLCGLMKENSFVSGRAILRAAGELVVIIVGVLIALWADQWWADLQDKRTERTYLAALTEDVDVTLASLERNLNSISRLRDAASTAFNKSDQFRSMDATLFGLALFEIDFVDHRLSSYQDLKNTGRLALIRDRSIRDGLAEVERMLEQVSAAQSDLVGLHHTVIDPFLARQPQFGHIALAGYAATDTGALGQAGYSSPSDLVDHATPFDADRLLSNPDLPGILALRIVLLSEMMESNVELTRILESLRGQIQAGSDYRASPAADGNR